jgi:hypothetical protein
VNWNPENFYLYKQKEEIESAISEDPNLGKLLRLMIPLFMDYNRHFEEMIGNRRVNVEITLSMSSFYARGYIIMLHRKPYLLCAGNGDYYEFFDKLYDLFERHPEVEMVYDEVVDIEENDL